MVFFARLAALLLVFSALADRTNAQPPRSAMAPRSQGGADAAMRDRINAWTIGLAGGLLEGAPIKFATEIARVVNDNSEMHILPIVTRGPTENVNDLLYLKGVDAAIINTDSVEEYKEQVPEIQQRITSIVNLFPSELHIFVRPEIKTL